MGKGCGNKKLVKKDTSRAWTLNFLEANLFVVSFKATRAVVRTSTAGSTCVLRNPDVYVSGKEVREIHRTNS